MSSPAPAGAKSSNFFLGFLFLSAERRAALTDVYEYCRIIDDIVDEGLAKDDAAKQLSWWSDEIGRLYQGKPTLPLTQRLQGHIARFHLPKEAFDEMIRGCRMDLDCFHYRTLADLELYMRGVAVSVGMMSTRIFGYDNDEFAREFGYAFQLTNIIRDVGADLELGRIYLPDSEMKAAGYDADRLRRREHDAAFDRLMDSLYARAKAHYARGRALVDFADRATILPAEVMAHIYEGVLDRVAAEGFPVLREKVRLSAPRKALLAGKAWLYCHGIEL